MFVAPVSNIVVTGARWLHDGELLNLGVSCNGSSPYVYCIKIVPGEYNVTGSETCLKERIITECQLNVSHYFRTTNTSTVLIIIKNEVTKKIASAVINIYEGKCDLVNVIFYNKHYLTPRYHNPLVIVQSC